MRHIMADPAIAHLQEHLLERMEHWSGSSVSAAVSLDPAFRTAPAALLDVLAAQREPLLTWFDQVLRASGDAGDRRWPTDPAGFLAVRLLRWLQSKNQYLDLGAALHQQARELYGASAAAMGAALARTTHDRHLRDAVEQALADHQRRLAAFLEALARSPGVPGPAFVYREAVRGSYSPELQLQVLGLAGEALQEPILDLGCGEHGGLVHALRAAGLTAVGLDRLADQQADLIAADWFDLDLPQASWGTIISHLAFSQQFLHQHLRGGPGSERYARKYLAILRALRPGGIFAYAPSVPFIEDLLPPARWRVVRRAISPSMSETSPASRLLSLPFQASHVERLA